MISLHTPNHGNHFSFPEHISVIVDSSVSLVLFEGMFFGWIVCIERVCAYDLVAMRDSVENCYLVRFCVLQITFTTHDEDFVRVDRH